MYENRNNQKNHRYFVSFMHDVCSGYSGENNSLYHTGKYGLECICCWYCINCILDGLHVTTAWHNMFEKIMLA